MAKGHLHFSGPHAEALMKRHKPGDKVTMKVNGVITSMEARDGLDQVFDPGGKAPSKKTHHISMDVRDVEDAADERPGDESE